MAGDQFVLAFNRMAEVIIKGLVIDDVGECVEFLRCKLRNLHAVRDLRFRRDLQRLQSVELDDAHLRLHFVFEQRAELRHGVVGGQVHLDLEDLVARVSENEVEF